MSILFIGRRMCDLGVNIGLQPFQLLPNSSPISRAINRVRPAIANTQLPDCVNPFYLIPRICSTIATAYSLAHHIFFRALLAISHCDEANTLHPMLDNGLDA